MSYLNKDQHRPVRNQECKQCGHQLNELDIFTGKCPNGHPIDGLKKNNNVVLSSLGLDQMQVKNFIDNVYIAHSRDKILHISHAAYWHPGFDRLCFSVIAVISNES